MLTFAGGATSMSDVEAVIVDDDSTAYGHPTKARCAPHAAYAREVSAAVQADTGETRTNSASSATRTDGGVVRAANGRPAAEVHAIVDEGALSRGPE